MHALQARVKPKFVRKQHECAERRALAPLVQPWPARAAPGGLWSRFACTRTRPGRTERSRRSRDQVSPISRDVATWPTAEPQRERCGGAQAQRIARIRSSCRGSALRRLLDVLDGSIQAGGRNGPSVARDQGGTAAWRGGHARARVGRSPRRRRYFAFAPREAAGELERR